MGDMQADSGSSPTPVAEKSKSRIVAIVLFVTGIIGGTAALFENIDKIQTEVRKFIGYVGVKTETPPPIPSFPRFETDWMGGGHSQGEFCNPLLAKYQSENPKFIIEVIPGESSKKDWGVAKYKYNCVFVAKPR